MIVDFLRDNWQYISFALVVALDIAILIFKRVKLKLKIPSSSVPTIIELVNEAEKVYGEGHGREKLNFVIENYLSKYEINSVFKYMMIDYVKSVVEKVLETPQKKGVNE